MVVNSAVIVVVAELAVARARIGGNDVGVRQVLVVGGVVAVGVVAGGGVGREAPRAGLVRIEKRGAAGDVHLSFASVAAGASAAAGASSGAAVASALGAMLTLISSRCAHTPYKLVCRPVGIWGSVG